MSNFQYIGLLLVKKSGGLCGCANPSSQRHFLQVLHVRKVSTATPIEVKPPDFDYHLIRSLKPFPLWLQQEMRSNHAGETGAVNIYAGAKWALEVRRRANSSLFPFKDYERSALDFASHHQETEAEHLLAFDQILDQRPSQRQISMLLPAWRVAGFTLGAVSTLWCTRGIYVTTDAVETFVEKHYMSQINRLKSELDQQTISCDSLEIRAKTELLKLLQHCCEDEVDHRDEARSRAAEGPLPWWPWVDSLWKWMVEGGSAAAAALAKRG